MLHLLMITASASFLCLAPSRAVTPQELLLQGFSDEKPSRSQPSEQLRKIAHEPRPIGSFQDTQRPGKWEIPA